jgi:hypothetical protein
MAIYNPKTNTVYTDNDFLDILAKNKFWKEKDTNKLNVKSLNDFAKELGYDFVNEIKPNIFLFNEQIIDICKNKSITKIRDLEKWYLTKLPKSVKPPSYLDGFLHLKWLKSKIN